MNTVCIIGNLTRDPELRYTPQGDAVSNLNVAINEGYGDNQKVIYIGVVAWKKQAENCSQYLSKGSKVAVQGKLTQRSWESDGGKRTVIEIQAFAIDFLSPKKDSEQRKDTDEEVSDIEPF